MASNEELLTTVISPPQLALLKKLDFPCSEDVIDTATPVEDGLEISGTRNDFEDLAGWCAGEANHCDPRSRRKLALLDDLCESLEAALG
jgi:hypothetical protein